jgi:dihydrofolate reductase
LREKAVDVIVLTIIPRLLGEGIALFGGGPERSLELSGFESYPDGLVQLTYLLR